MNNCYFSNLAETYRDIHGPECVKRFIPRLSKIEKKARDDYNDDKSLKISGQDTIEINRAMKCRFSHGPFEFYKWENGQDIK